MGNQNKKKMVPGVPQVASQLRGVHHHGGVNTTIGHTTTQTWKRMTMKTNHYPVGSYKFGRISAGSFDCPLFLSDPEGEPDPEEFANPPAQILEGFRSRRKSWRAFWLRQPWRSCSRCSLRTSCATSPSMPRLRSQPFFRRRRSAAEPHFRATHGKGHPVEGSGPAVGADNMAVSVRSRPSFEARRRSRWRRRATTSRRPIRARCKAARRPLRRRPRSPLRRRPPEGSIPTNSPR